MDVAGINALSGTYTYRQGPARSNGTYPETIAG